MRDEKVLFWATSASELKFAASDTSSSHTSPRYLQSRGGRHRSYRCGYRHRHRGNRLRPHALLGFPIVARSYRMRSDRCSSSGTAIPHYQDPKLPSMQGECIIAVGRAVRRLHSGTLCQSDRRSKKMCARGGFRGEKSTRSTRKPVLPPVRSHSLVSSKLYVYLHCHENPAHLVVSSISPRLCSTVHLCAPGRAFPKMETMWTTARQIPFSHYYCGNRCAGHYPHSIHQVRVQIPQEMCGSVINQTPIKLPYDRWHSDRYELMIQFSEPIDPAMLLGS